MKIEELYYLLFVAIIISFACLGFRAITGKNMIFYFLRKPVDDIEPNVSWYGDAVIYMFKPMILCSTCMSSIHTLVWWPCLVGSYSIDTILVILMVAFLNTLLYGLIELIQKHTS